MLKSKFVKGKTMGVKNRLNMTCHLKGLSLSFQIIIKSTLSRYWTNGTKVMAVQKYIVCRLLWVHGMWVAMGTWYVGCYGYMVCRLLWVHGM